VKKTTRWTFAAVLGFLILASVFGCTKDPYMLGVMGYNYTDRAIADFLVNGQWGANHNSGAAQMARLVTRIRARRPLRIQRRDIARFKYRFRIAIARECDHHAA
jgi:hypothetical protein